jgi:hypothetical protein
MKQSSIVLCAAMMTAQTNAIQTSSSVQMSASQEDRLASALEKI